MTEDTKLTQLIINELTKAQYEALGDNVNEDEIYVITDDEVEIKSDGETIVGKGTKADPLAISPEFIEKVDTEISDRQNAISSLEQSINNTINELDEKLTESDANLQDQIAANSESITNLDKNKVNKSSLGIASGVATLDANAKVPMSQINDSLLGNVQYQGLYDVSTNTPNLDIVETKGHYYVVSVAGDRFDISFEVGDWIISNGVTWDKVDNTDAVSSVNGRTGNVVITKEDIDLSEHVKFTDYAGQDKAGVIKTSNGFGMSISATGCPLAVTATKSEYDSVNATYFIGKGTLENIKNDLVKRAVTENDITLTDEEKTAARTWIGAGNQTAQEDLQNELKNKADKSDTYTKSEVDGAIETVDDKVQKNTEDITTLNTNKANVSDLSSHTLNTSNPHNVTKAQVELGNVDNTSDLDKPISTATQNALDEKQDTLTAGTNITITGTTISAKDTTYTAGDGISITDGVISNTRVSAEWGNVTGDITAQEDLQNALTLKANQSTTYTKSQTDAAINVVSDRVTTNTASITSINQSVEVLQSSKADTTDLSSHTSNASNPHNVTAEQVGLGNVDNTSDADKPISTATQTALNAKADKNSTYTKTEVDAKISSVYRFVGSVATVNALPANATVGDTYNVEDTGANYAWTGTAWDKLSETIDLTPYLTKSEASTTYETIENVGLHTGNKNNPHGVTKAQVGLGNVDNTSDANKPISTATQTALDKKQNTLTQAQLNAVNSGITAAKVSTYDNYATEIAGKQPAGDYATNTSLSQGLDGKVDKNQGVASAGKVLAVNEQGVVEPTEIKAGGVNATYDATNHRITFA